MSEENCVNSGQGTSEKKNFLFNREENVRKKVDGSSMRESKRTNFLRSDRASEIFLTKIGPEVRKEQTDHQLRCLEEKIDNLKVNLDEVTIGTRTPSTGRTVKLGRAPKEDILMESAYRSLMDVRESVNRRLENMLREQELLQKEIKSSDNESLSPRSVASGSQKSVPRTFSIEDIQSIQYQHLRECKDIVDKLFNREIQSIKNRNLIHSGAGDGKTFSEDIFPFQTDTLASADIKTQRKNLVEKICVMSQQLKELEKHEKL